MCVIVGDGLGVAEGELGSCRVSLNGWRKFHRRCIRFWDWRGESVATAGHPCCYNNEKNPPEGKTHAYRNFSTRLTHHLTRGRQKARDLNRYLWQ